MTPEHAVHHQHAHRTGHRLLDLALPVSALLISVAALGEPDVRPNLSLGVTVPMVMRAGTDTLILGMKREGNEVVWDKLNAERFRLRFRACYCSVFDECWVSDLSTVSPQSVEHCAVTPNTFTFLNTSKAEPVPQPAKQ